MILLSRLHFGVRCKAVWEFLQTFIEFLLTEIKFLTEETRFFLLKILFWDTEINLNGNRHRYIPVKNQDEIRKITGRNRVYIVIKIG